MSGAIPPLLQYAFMAWCLVKEFLERRREYKNILIFTFLGRR
jgi:hypothetical protein